MRISDWSSDVCSSDLDGRVGHSVLRNNLVTTRGQAYTSTKPGGTGMIRFATMTVLLLTGTAVLAQDRDLAVTIYSGDLALVQDTRSMAIGQGRQKLEFPDVSAQIRPETVRSEEHTSELQSLMRISSAV